MNKGGKFLKKLWCCVGGEYLVNKPLQAAGMSADNVRG